MQNITKIALVGALTFGLGAASLTATPAFAKGGHGGPEGVIVTVGGVQHVIAVDNLPADFQPAANVQVIAHVPGARATRTSFQARRKAKKAAERAARDAARGR